MKRKNAPAPTIKTLPLHPAEISIAQDTLISCRERLPSGIRDKLIRRNTLQKHPVNCIQYYSVPLHINTEYLKQMKTWGLCYAELLEKITRSYLNEPEGYIRQFLDTSLAVYLTPWLKTVIDSYRTCNHLAGAHLGDDHFSGRSIEWNLGAVGGLEEGAGTTEEINKNVKPGQNNLSPCSPHSCRDIHSVPPFPTDTNSIESVLDALLYSYECHCRSNNTTQKSNPCIAYIEHDDIYYSSVRTVRKLRESGADIIYTFHQTLTYGDNQLRTRNGDVIDILYMDCHLEDLHPTHPITIALQNNKVALDSSPFARLLLRSKVLMALLSTQECHEALKLSKGEVQMIHGHLAHSVLLNQYSPCPSPPDDHHNSKISDVSHNLSNTYNRITPLKQKDAPCEGLDPLKGKDAPCEGLDPLKEKVVKIAIGSVFGGKGVMVFKPETPLTNIIKKFKPLKSLISHLAREHCPVSCAETVKFTMEVDTKALFTEIFKTSADNTSKSSANEMKKNFYHSVNKSLQQHKNLLCKDLEAIIRQNLFSFLDESSVNGKLIDRLMTRYRQFFMEKMMTRNLPVVVQDFIEPDRVEEMEELMGKTTYISHRIHVLFTTQGKQVFIAGSQLFPISHGKQDNRQKMTCALLH